MNPKIIGGVEMVCAVLAVLLGFLEQSFFALLFLAIALIVAGIDKFTESPSAPAPVPQPQMYQQRARQRPMPQRRRM